jgi:hypothetical protein
MTGNDEDNFYIQNRYQNREGLRGNYRLISKKEVVNSRYSSNSLFGPYATFLLLNRSARRVGKISQLVINEVEVLGQTVDILRKQKLTPLYVQCTASGDIRFFSSNDNTVEVTSGDILFYLGEPIDEELLPKKVAVTAPADNMDEDVRIDDDKIPVSDGGI